MRPRPLLRAALGTSRHCDPRPEVRFQRRPLGSLTWSRHLRPAVTLSPNLNPRWCCQAPIRRALLSNLSLWGPLNKKTGFLLSPTMTPWYLVLCKTPKEGGTSMAPWSPPLYYYTAIIDTKTTNKSLGFRPTLALISDPEHLASGTSDWACHTIEPDPKASWCFQTSVPRVLPHKPTSLGIP